MKTRRATTPTRRRQFGHTWWGVAWVTALEDRARLDPNRLPRGRTYARSGAVGELEVSAGAVRAPVRGRRPAPYQVRVRVRVFTPPEWDRVLDAIAGQIGHVAALLEGELPPEVAEDVLAVGLDLLPGPGEVQPRCSCPDWADPCKHAAAVCYLVADLIDTDPFRLLLLRGRDRDDVLGALRARRAAAGAPRHAGSFVFPGDPDTGVEARAAYVDSAKPPLPLTPLPPVRPGHPAALSTPPPELADALRALAADAAARAWSLAVGEGDGGLTLAVDADLARRAAAALGSADFDQLAILAKRRRRDLARAALAWQAGGPDGLNVLTDSWRPDPDAVAEARRALGRESTARANRVTRGDIQLRLGRDGRWYRFHRHRGAWDPDGQPDADPSALVARD
ncbi:MAG: SWIM zinc finger family protein [Nocardioidaceae bacterium]